MKALALAALAVVTIHHSGGQIPCTLKEPGIVWSPSGTIQMNCVEDYTKSVSPPPQPGKLDPSCYAICMAMGKRDKAACTIDCTK